MMNYKILLISFITILITGCASVGMECKPIVKVETVEVLKPVPCKVDKITCDFNGVGLEPMSKMLECIVMQKRALEACTAELK